MLVPLCGRDDLPEPAGQALVPQAREAVHEECLQVPGERASLPFGDDHQRVTCQGIGDHGTFRRPPAVDRLPSHARLGRDRVDRDAITPVRRVGKPEDVAGAIVYLAGAGFVTGTVLECTGGSNLTAAALAG